MKGRPEVKIEPDTIRVLAARDCNRKEMAALLKVGYATLRRRFDDHERTPGGECPESCRACAFECAEIEGRDHGNAVLRSKLFQLGANGNIAALIFLAKNRLDYTDRHEVTDKREHSLNSAIAELAALGPEEIQRRRAAIMSHQLPAAPIVIDAEIIKPKKGKKQHAKT